MCYFIREALDGHCTQLSCRPMQPGDVPETCADVAHLKAAVGFAPDTPIEEGVNRFVEWYRGYIA